MTDPQAGRRRATPRRTGREFVESPILAPPVKDPSIRYGRLVVAVVLGAVLSVAAVATAVGQYYAALQEPVAPTEVTIGGWGLLVSEALPPAQLVLTAILAMVGVAVFAVSFEVIAALMAISPRRRMLSARRARRLTPMEPNAKVRITVLVPAHNEEFSLPTTLGALAEQTRPPDRVIVVADNCSDRTVEIARQMGHEAFETVDNTHKKGGALNQALARILPVTGPTDVVLVMDADTSLAPRFLEVAAAHLEADQELAAVGGIFFGEDGHGLIGQFQRNEYTRYGLQIRARRGRVFVLTGTATMFRAEALLDVAAARGVFIPGQPGKVYDTAALTEDNELTLALKSLGATMMSPPECMVTTELMPNWKALWKQRQRWQRGALENLSQYGVTRATIRYWGQQVGIGYGAFALQLALLLMLITFVSIDQWIWFPFWTAVGAIFVAERVITAWRAGWRGRLLALSLFPELAYDVFLQIVFASCLFDITFARQAKWTHVQHATGKVTT